MHGKRKIGRPKGETSNLIPRPKKKRGRKRIFHKTEAENEGMIEEDNTAIVEENQNYDLSQDMVSQSAGMSLNFLHRAVKYGLFH